MDGTIATGTCRHTVMETVLGALTLVRDDEGLRGLYFPDHWHRLDPATFGPRSEDGFAEVTAQLGEYLAGERQRFALPLVLDGTLLQRQVWDLVAAVPYGETVSYGSLAVRLGGGGDVSARAIGAAVGRNPLCVIVPCHRVVGADGKLTGYAGGVERKRFLLDMERSVSAATSDV